MAVDNSDNAISHLRTLFNVGAIGALSDGQLLERFANGRGEPRELAFAALVERYGPFVLRVCRSILRDSHAAEDAFQATFLVLARKAGSLWAQGSLAPWLHQAAYRAALHDRSATLRRRAHEHAAAALRPESVAPPQPDNHHDLETMIHEEIGRLPSPYRVAVVLCDLEGRTHEQAANYLGCAVGTVKSRLARGRKRLRGRLARRGVAPTAALAAAFAGGAARAAVPVALAESTVAYAAMASAVPRSVAVITEGVLTSMFPSKIKVVMRTAAVLAALAAGAIVLAQSGDSEPKDGTGKPKHVDSASWTYHILVSRNGQPPRKVAVVEMSGDTPIRVDAPGALILIQPKRDGESDRQTAVEKRDRAGRAEGSGDKAGRSPESAAANGANPSNADPFRPENEQKARKIVLTSPKVMDVDLTQRYVCKIHAHRHIRIRALVNGFLDEISVKEGQTVKQGDLLFKVVSPQNKATFDAEVAERDLAKLELDNAKVLFNQKVVAQSELKLREAKLAKAQAKVDLATTGLDFATVKAPFEGTIDRFEQQEGSLLKEGDDVTTLSDNSKIWVYFNVPERQYLEYIANTKQRESDKVELELADHTKFPHPGKIGAIEAQFNNSTGNIAFRADFPNPERLLRHGQTGTILIHRTVRHATVIPLRAAYETGNKRYLYIVDNHDVAHRREFIPELEMDDICVIKNGVGTGDRIVVDGIVRDGEKAEYEFRSLEEVMPKLKNEAK